MNEVLLGIRLVTNDIRSFLIKKQMENSVSNEAMCFVLKDLLADFEAGTTNEYARVIAGLMTEKDKHNAHNAEVENDNAENQTQSNTGRSSAEG